MQAIEFTWSTGQGFSTPVAKAHDSDLVLYFGAREALEQGDWFARWREAFPRATIFGCSTGGQIMHADIVDGVIAAVALRFDRTRLRKVVAPIGLASGSRDCGRNIGQQLVAHDLAGVLLLSDGLQVNGTHLVEGIVEVLGGQVPVCGGLAGDGAAFSTTLVGLDAQPTSGLVAAVGLYGTDIAVGSGSAGGWEVFGPNRVVTRSEGNILRELDGQPALDLYERYLCADDIAGLPGTALLYPLLIRNPECSKQELVRTILAVDRQARTMTFAGDMPVGWSAQLMRGSFERLAEGAASAAKSAADAIVQIGKDQPPTSVAVMISCIGRRLMMGQRVSDEIEAAMACFPPGTAGIGFYSYGEIAPHAATGFCDLHNQTMTIMTLSERAA
ncbi:MAG TPA: FIST N-terminal domain-containing protein [Beijerinckiaceae bacterium]|nr:FIST N-terminal domain-containing protein [Beijerinckiaceae bacterium]